ncbi:hypothetical protein SGLAM104S_05113 [Streptomyces glaucescens]
MAHSWYFVPDLVTTSLVYPDRREAISPQGSTTSRKGLRIRSRSSFADTAGRSVKAVTSGTARRQRRERHPRRATVTGDDRVDAEPRGEAEQQHTSGDARG